MLDHCRYGRYPISPPVTGDLAASSVEDLVAEAVRSHLLDDSESARAAYGHFLKLSRRLGAQRATAMDLAEALFRSEDAAKRATAADLFGRLAYGASADEEQRCLRELEAALSSETAGAGNVDVLRCIVSSFGQIGQLECLRFVIAMAHHPSPAVRSDVAAAIPSVVSFQVVAEAVSVLVELSADDDSDVRDWACFGLGQLNADSGEVREALAARLNDVDTDTRCEALLALAQLGDQRARKQVDKRLAARDNLCSLEVEAAAALGDVRWYDELGEMLSRWENDDDFEYWKPMLDLAIRRCDPAQHDRAAQVEAMLSAGLASRAEGTDLTATLTGSYPQTRLVVADRQAVVMVDKPLWEHDQLPAEMDVEARLEAWSMMVTSTETH